MDFCSHGRHFAADFSWGGWKIRVIGAHMDANNDREPYRASLNDLEYILDRARMITSLSWAQTRRSSWAFKGRSTTISS